MARVPTTQGGFIERRAATMPALQSADMTEGARILGGAVERFGGALSREADAMDQLDAQRDEAAAKLLDNEYSEWSRNRLVAGDGAFFTLEGFNADAQRGAVEKEVEEMQARLVERASTGRQRQMVTDALNRRVQADLDGIARHSVQQYRVEERRQMDARITSAQNDALAYADNPVRYGEELLVGEAEIRARAARTGAAPETVTQEIAQWRSGVHTARGAALIERGEIDNAIAWLGEHRGDLTADDENKLEAALYRPRFERKIDGLADFVMAGGEPLAPGADPDPDGANGTTTNPVVAAPRREGFVIASPVEGGRITSRYGTRDAPIAGASTNHRALDIAAPAGTPIVAQAPGRVVSARSEGGAGNVVRIDYGNGVVVSYAHMQGFNVKEGDVVEAGAQLGAVGSTGNSTGPHVHQVVRVNGERVDPETFNGQIGGSISGDGAGAAPEARAQQHDLGTLLARVDAMGLPFEEEKALKDEIRNRVQTDEALRRRQQDQALDRASELLDRADAAGNSIKRESQIPADVWAAMDPRDRMSIRDVIARNAQPEPRETNYGEYTRLSDLYATDPTAFARLNPATYRNALDDTDYERVLGWRRDVLGGGGSTSQVAHSRVRSIAGRVRAVQGLTTTGIPTARGEDRRIMERRIYNYERAVNREVEFWQRANPGKTVTDDVILEIANRQLAETRPQGSARPDAEGRSYWFERERGARYTVQMPRSDYERLRRIGREELGREPTGEEINAAWQAEARGGY